MVSHSSGSRLTEPDAQAAANGAGAAPNTHAQPATRAAVELGASEVGASAAHLAPQADSAAGAATDVPFANAEAVATRDLAGTKVDASAAHLVPQADSAAGAATDVLFANAGAVGTRDLAGTKVGASAAHLVPQAVLASADTAAAGSETAASEAAPPIAEPAVSEAGHVLSVNRREAAVGTGHSAVAESASAAAPDPADPPRPTTNRRAQLARLAFLALTLAAGAYAVARQWTRVRAGFADLGPGPLAAALVPALGSVVAMMLAWRGLLAALGSPLRLRPAARVFFTSQLGKYLPGAVWPVVAQMQLGRAHRIPRTRSAAAAALAMLISLATALVLAAATLSAAGGAKAAGYWWAFAAVPVLVAGLHPKVANPVRRTIFRVTRRPAIEPPTGATIAKTAARSLVGWLLAGAHIWVLAVALGASPARTLLLAIGGYAFAWSVGFLIVFAPAGAGVRELILVAALQPVLDPGKATVVALASRLVTIVADLVAAAVTARDSKAGHEASAERVPGSALTTP